MWNVKCALWGLLDVWLSLARRAQMEMEMETERQRERERVSVCSPPTAHTRVSLFSLFLPARKHMVAASKGVLITW